MLVPQFPFGSACTDVIPPYLPHIYFSILHCHLVEYIKARELLRSPLASVF